MRWSWGTDTPALPGGEALACSDAQAFGHEVAPVPLEVPLAVPTRNAPAEALAPADQTPAPDTSAPDTCKSGVDFTAMADSTSLSDERMDSRASDVQESDPPAIATAARSLGSKDTVTAFLLAVLADGPLRARKIERMAAREGLLADGKGIGDAKPFLGAPWSGAAARVGHLPFWTEHKSLTSGRQPRPR
jgi:hypothetical protein